RVRDPMGDEPGGDLGGSPVILLHKGCLAHNLPSVQREMGKALGSLLWKVKHKAQERGENMATRQARRDSRAQARIRALQRTDQGRNAYSVELSGCNNIYVNV